MICVQVIPSGNWRKSSNLMNFVKQIASRRAYTENHLRRWPWLRQTARSSSGSKNIKISFQILRIIWNTSNTSKSLYLYFKINTQIYVLQLVRNILWSNRIVVLEVGSPHIKNYSMKFVFNVYNRLYILVWIHLIIFWPMWWHNPRSSEIIGPIKDTRK